MIRAGNDAVFLELAFLDLLAVLHGDFLHLCGDLRGERRVGSVLERTGYIERLLEVYDHAHPRA